MSTTSGFTVSMKSGLEDRNNVAHIWTHAR